MLGELINNILCESIYDKYLFKAVFMAGGTASGKTLIGKKMFMGFPVKFVDSDSYFVKLLKQADLSLHIDPTISDVYAMQQDKREKAKQLMTKSANIWIKGMLPLIIDGTAKSYGKITRQKEILEKIGYDTAMVFVDTALEVAIKRGAERERKVDVETATKAWHSAQANREKFMKLFGDSFMKVDNSNEITDAEMARVTTEMTRRAMKFIHTPLRNPEGVRKLQSLEAIGKSYLGDLGDEIPEFYV